ncbi:MAG TPA: Gfo/Idh/MocA family oxidoreductase [Thermohalobaculum sp.]|nr:Gfo/Idh/MocA family oxidoreductase [Thermohalobaculum sp.]
MIGFGRIAAGFATDAKIAKMHRFASHAQVLATHPRFEWVGVAEPDAAKRASATGDWMVAHATESAAALASLVAPEVVVLAMPPGGRLEALDAFDTVRAVVVEKPLGGSVAEAERFLAHCRQNDILVQTNFWRRAEPLFRGLADGGLEGRIGRVQGAAAVYGGGLRNNGSHLIDLCRMLFGEIETVQTLSSVKNADRSAIAGDFEAAFALHHAGGVTVSAMPLDFGAYREIALEIWGMDGRISLTQETTLLREYRPTAHRQLEGANEIAGDSAPRAEAHISGTALYALYDNLVEALDADAELWAAGADALAAERVIEAVAGSSAASGVRVSLRS